MKIKQCKTKQEFIEAYGFDWYKIKKIEGGYIGFESRQEYETRMKQK